MRRLLPPLAAVPVLFSLLVFSQQGSLAGDADGNGVLSPFDLDAILDQILGDTPETANADTNGDGKVDIADWVKLNSILFPTDPAAVVPAFDLELSQSKVAAGGPLAASWTLSGIRDTSGVELLLRAVEPGTVVSTGDELTFTPGVIPGNGKTFYRTPDESWAETETVLGPSSVQQASFTLPSEAEGEWLIEVIARDSESAVPLTIGTERLMAGDSATMRLFLNRPLANTNDRVALTLQTTAGEENQEVAITALMYLPDGSISSLPGLNDRITSLYEGPAQDAEHVLGSNMVWRPCSLESAPLQGHL